METATRDVERIRMLNDHLRTMFTGGRVFMTAGVTCLSDEVRQWVISAVRSYSTFIPENDPYGEHDFGSFFLAQEHFYWKIDYYDRAMQHGSDDPADTSKTVRVLTIMLASEY